MAGDAKPRKLLSVIRFYSVWVLLVGVMQLVHTNASRAQGQEVKPLSVATDSLPDASTGDYYGVTIYAKGGKRPYGFTATGLPDGLFISRNSDRIMGIAKTTGTYMPSITVEDSSLPSNKASATLKLVVVQK